MTIDEYRRSSPALQKATLGSAISLVLTAFATLVSMQLNLSDKPMVEFVSVVKYVTGGFLMFIMNRVEKKVNYAVIPSQNTLPADSTESR